VVAKNLNATDRAWLVADRHDMPLHVGALVVFSPPETDGPDFVRTMVARFKETQTFARPFNQRLRSSSRLVPSWKVLADDEIDLDYHLRHSALPRPGGERELGVLVSRLHSRPLDFTRPLWELHVIEGLEDGKFALYGKVHHSVMDGVGGARRFASMLSSDPEDDSGLPVWAIGAKKKGVAKKERPRISLLRKVSETVTVTGAFAMATAEVAGQALRRPGDGVATLFGAPRSVLNEQITQQRRVATQSFELARIKRVAKAAGGTVNDVFLSVCASALHRYLDEIGELPGESLTAGTPVSVRDPEDTTPGNAFSMVLVDLYTQLTDPLERFRGIAHSSAVAKENLKRQHKTVADNYAVLLFGPFIAELLTRTAGKTRPPCNIIISNVPGPTGPPLYFHGAKLEHLYPLSLVFDGSAVNITAFSAGDRFNVGIVGCRDALPHLQRLAVYHGEALDELEAATAG
jgi:WS/DGAT/MGAT family acyltransferase